MDDLTFAALQKLVNLARFSGHRRLASARQATIAAGYPESAVDAAIKFWADYECRKRF